MKRGLGRFAGSRHLDAAIVAGLALTDGAGIVADVVRDRVVEWPAIVGLAVVAAVSSSIFWWRRPWTPWPPRCRASC
jgi:hypothetical protein